MLDARKLLASAALILILSEDRVSASRVNGYIEYDGKRISVSTKPARRANGKTYEQCAELCARFSSIRCTVFSMRKKGMRCLMYDVDQLLARNFEELLTKAKGFITFRNAAAGLLHVPDCIADWDRRGRLYTGRRSQTVEGKTCQRWDQDSPHRPNFRPIMPEIHENFCRNPDGDVGGPWCYTTDPNLRWQHCNIPKCSATTTMPPATTRRRTRRPTTTPRTTRQRRTTTTALISEPPPPIPPSPPTPEPVPGVCFVCNGLDYIGLLNHTVSGKTCQAWSSSTPHQHSNHPNQKPDRNLEGNYCRNPDGDLKPWCYTTDPNTRWEYCDAKRCTNPDGSILIPRQRYTTECTTGRGQNYRGTVSTTRSGFTCASWSSQSPHEHTRTPENFPCSGLDSNHCRNPSANFEEGPWCYTTDPNKRWELCDIPKCGPDGRPITTTTTTTRRTTTRTTAPTPATTRSTSIPPNPSGCGVPEIQSNYVLQAFRIVDNEFVPSGRRKRNAKKESERILGGDVANHGSWPWSVSIRYYDGHFCGGTLIKPQWVLTAAHCLDDNASVGPMTIKVGHNSGDEPELQVRNVERYMMHERYSKSNVKNDIALIKLRSPFNINTYVKLACLPNAEYIVPGDSYCVATGWGNTYDPNYKNELKQVVLPVHSYRDCLRYMGSHMVDKTQMCAGYRQQGKDTCRGDSGGPLVCLNNDHWTVQGVTSWGSGCEDKKGSYGSYTRVSKYVDWINSNIARFP